MKQFTRLFSLLLVFVFAFGFTNAQNTIQTISQQQVIQESGVNQTPLKPADQNSTLLEEGFDVAGDFPPTGWTHIQTAPNPDDTWIQTNPSDPAINFDNIDSESLYSAMVPHEPDNDQDEWLITPEINAGGETPTVLEFYEITCKSYTPTQDQQTTNVHGKETC